MKTFKTILLLLYCTFMLLSIALAAETTSKCSTVKLVEWKAGTAIHYGQYVPEENGEVLSPEDINQPRSLILDSKGNIYIGDSVNYRILKFDKDGRFLMKFALQKPLRGNKQPFGDVIKDMAVDVHDNLYVINLYEYRIEMYNPSGKLVKTINYLSDKLGLGKDFWEAAGRGYEADYLDLDKDGKIYVYSDYSQKMALGGIYSRDGKLLTRGIKFDDFGGTKLDFLRRFIRFTGYSLDILSEVGGMKKDNAIAVLNNAGGKELSRCSINIEPTTRTYIDKKGNVYFFEHNTLDVMMARMLQE
ncbi:MAG: hypothetical protein A2X57_01125 [Nitrospirae bacterium GWD2_57_8]|nr:MAG: hypothetical protein A2X57_01125 [Nitrospirae bacterium GWD2_57_8]